MTVNIKTTKEQIFKQYLTLINPLVGKNKLSPVEIEVMSRFLLIQFNHPHLDEIQIGKIAFHKNVKKLIRESIKEDTKIDLSQASFNNQLLSLRKKKFLEGNAIKHKPYTTKEGNISLTFNLNIV